jgi:hypothetical protein
MTRFIYISLLTLTGFILTPTATYACGLKSENIENTCIKQSDTEKENKDCCNTDKEHCDKHGNHCNGNCGNPDCHCPTTCTNFTVPFFVQFSQTKIILSKPKFHYQEAFYSAGFISMWLPPKIG